MPKPFETWTVLPHGKLGAVDDRILSVIGELHMPFGDVSRRMTVVRLRDGRLVIYSAIALHEAEMVQLEAFGKPSILIVPSASHRVDAKPWKDRYPGIVVVAPRGARDKVDKLVPVDTTTLDFDDPSVRLVSVGGLGDHELALEVDDATGTTLVVNDLLWNVPNKSGASGFMFRLMGLSGDEPKMPGLISMRLIDDEVALKEQLEHWAKLPRLSRILMAHGRPLIDNPSGVLERLASELN